MESREPYDKRSRVQRDWPTRLTWRTPGLPCTASMNSGGASGRSSPSESTVPNSMPASRASGSRPSSTPSLIDGSGAGSTDAGPVGVVDALGDARATPVTCTAQWCAAQ
jgi:hypothetical protein